MPDSLTPKAAQTRAAILATALGLFREEGYDRTTMRAVAKEAGVSLGSTYYYFASKEHLVQAFYDELLAEHEAAVEDVLARESGFADRLRGSLDAWLAVAEPHHAFAAQFFRNAADPASPLSPFSAESAPAREGSVALMRRLLEGSDAKVSRRLEGRLPELLWLLQMGVVLFWVYDASTGQQRTRVLVRGVVPLVDRLVRMSRLPVLRGVVDDVLTLLDAVSGNGES
ncbi:TetR family transcriptional regulator [Nocardioides humi]|uniref:TetR family transcriptional regulator n=2 Tax=Nocardioides humi TaxID=449461 RepID=A0ABN2BHJ6_9ACTN